MFRLDHPIAWKFISGAVPGPSQWFFHFGGEILITWTQEKTTTLGGTEPHHSSWQCKESHSCCCHGSLAPLAIGDSGTSTVLTRNESMRLLSLRQNEWTTARDPVQHKIWIYPCYRMVDTVHQQRRTHWWCTTPSKRLAKCNKLGGRVYWRYENVATLWIKPCQKYRTVSITFHPTLVYMYIQCVSPMLSIYV